MIGEEEKMLRDAIARKRGAIFSVPADGKLRHCKSGFLGQIEEDILMVATAEQIELVQAVLASGEECVIVFKSAGLKIGFPSKIERVIPAGSEGVDSDALLFKFPQSIKKLQRRAHYRARVPAGFKMPVRVWRIPEHAYLKDVPTRAQEVTCTVRDLSIGGMGVRFMGKNNIRPKIAPGERLRIQITLGNQSMVMEGRMSEPRPDPDPSAIGAGIRFKKREDNVQGRQILSHLTRLISNLQREELRALKEPHKAA